MIISYNRNPSIRNARQHNHLDLIYKLMNKKYINPGKAVLALKKCTDKQEDYQRFINSFPEIEKYISLI